MNEENLRLESSRLIHRGYKAWEIQRQYHTVKTNTFTPWNRHIEAIGNLKLTLDYMAGKDNALAYRYPFTPKEATETLTVYENAMSNLHTFLYGQWLVRGSYRISQKNGEWRVEHYRPKGWHRIASSIRWEVAIYGMMDMNLAGVYYHPYNLRTKITAVSGGLIRFGRKKNERALRNGRP